MSFLANAFGGGGPPPLGSAANPILPVPQAVAAPTPAPPTPPAALPAQAPQSFAPTQAAAQRQAQIAAGTPTFLGAGAAGSTQKTKATLG